MKKLKHTHRPVFRHEFTEKQMRAYFKRKSRSKEIILSLSFLSAFLFAFLILYFPGFFLILLCAIVAFSLIAIIALLILLFGTQPPTDEEYDAWVKARARTALRTQLDQLDHDLSEEEIDQIPFIHGFVLEGTTNASNYRPQDLYWKWGKDKIQRYSINVFRYFLDLKHQLAVIIIDINAVNHHDRREQNQEFFYIDVVAVATVDERDILTDKNGIEHDYRTQSFELRISDGKPVSATIRSLPLDYEEKLDTFDLPSSEKVENMISRLRMLIRSRKQGVSQERSRSEEFF